MGDQSAFIKSIKDATIAACKGQNIVVSIAMAQACLESNFGLSGLSLNCNNFFGIKAGSHWTGKTRTYQTLEYDKTQGHSIKVMAEFCVFDSFEDCIKEHNAMLHRVPTYTIHGLFTCNSAEGQANILRMAGYATDPAYPQKLMKLVNEFNLKQYDDV